MASKGLDHETLRPNDPDRSVYVVWGISGAAPRAIGTLDVTGGAPSVLTAGAWRALVGYRYLQRDAVIDAYTDSDFHFGGTDAKGYYLTADLGVANRVWLTVRYMSASQIDGPTYIIDTAQIDLSTRF